MSGSSHRVMSGSFLRIIVETIAGKAIWASLADDRLAFDPLG